MVTHLRRHGSDRWASGRPSSACGMSPAMVVAWLAVMSPSWVAPGAALLAHPGGAALLAHPGGAALRRPLPARCTVLAARKMEGKGGVEQVYVTLEEDGSDAWRADEAVRILADGGMGVLPTETGYSFVTKVSSKKGVERILTIKGAEDSKKPLSLLCIDHATIDR